MRHLLHPVVGLGIAALVLSGCTEEKAQALRAAAQHFDAQVQTAVNALTALYKFEVTPSGLLDDNADSDILAQATAKGLPADDFLKLLNLPYRQEARLALVDTYFKGFATHYSAWNQSLNDLPRATLTAARLVPCTADYGALVTRDLAKVAGTVRALPDTPFVALDEITGKMNAIAHQLKAEEAKSGGGDTNRKALLREQFTQLKSRATTLNQQRHTLAEAALTQLATAITAGDQAIALARDYDRLDVATVLALINDGMAQANVLAKGGLRDTLETLALFDAKLQSDPYWQRVGALQLTDIANACGKSEK